LHIICHGDFDSQNNEFYLEFENSRAELMKLSSSKLRELLAGNNLEKIDLVFVNACHSEEVAKVFLEFGVKCVVLI